ncbi:CRTAC1 family protein [Botrimarina mediterranea]|uniref:FG-GAP repeat protein n=1 Tax=Botrimarina mediterranea TaxID=2528022 RepID=A0A518K473_9BACT|nr:CRTAC1 family protein [Botrimarina mediterranea]QDV72598.1 FG-GAP repeat protein [Botrimarina mediterranea]QDV77170.1 FG-GAP repeat protein [Planctomycetes bacterium K2D]
MMQLRFVSPLRALTVAISLLGVMEPTLAATFSEQGASILWGANYAGRSVSLADIDNDGDLDMYFQGSTSSDRQLWRNNLTEMGSLTFTNVTASRLPSGSLSNSWSAGWADYDGDGFVDVFVGQTNSGSTRGSLLKNDGDEFSKITSSFVGLNDPGFHQNVGWADINNDKRLDLIIGMEGPERHEIYLQGASGQFTPTGQDAGFQVAYGTKGYGLAMGDYDGDGDLDVYISTCRAGGNIRNNFFKNMLTETGSLSFVDIADTNGTQFMGNSYGTEFVDFDNDGRLDLYMTGADGSDTKIWRNDGNDQFTDVDTILGRKLLNNMNGEDLNGSKAVDYDNDGDLDLYFHDNLASGGNHRLYRNDGNWEFTNVTAIEGLNTTGDGSPVGAGAYDSAWGDLDRDGDQDLVHPNNSTYGGSIPTPERVYISDASTNGNHWLYIELEGPSWNTTGLGSTIYATIDEGVLEGETLRREANTNIGTFNQSDLPVHFGLADATVVEELLIVWPDGSKQGLQSVAADQYLTVTFLPGDYSGDGVVDAADYTVWRDGLGDQFVQSDYDVWLANYGSPLVSRATSTVPEPVGLAAALLGVIAIARRPRKRA